MPKKTKTFTKDDIFVSIVVVATNELIDLVNVIRSLSKILFDSYTNYEIIVVDNGVPESEMSELSKQLDTLACLRIITLSRTSRYDTAVFAGLELAIGDYVCVMNPNTDPTEAITDMIERNKTSSTVQGVSKTPVKGMFGLRLGRKIFYWYNRKYIGVDIPIDATYFAAYSRTAINALVASKRSHRHIRHLVRLVGYRPKNYPYTPLKNPLHRRTMKTGAVEALEIAANYSMHPLRFVTWIGFFAGIINILYITYIIAVYLVSSEVMPGWTTMSLQLSVMFFVLFTIMVILAEYIGRILIESQKEPQYYIVDEQSSTVSIADQVRRNIEK